MNNKFSLKPDLPRGTKLVGIQKHSLGTGMLPQELFMKMLRLERKRTERSRRRFVLMLLDLGRLLETSGEKQALAALFSAIARSTRDTDLKGWYQDGSVLGVIFTEIGAAEDKFAVQRISTKVTNALYEALSIPKINNIRISFHVFPEDWEEDDDSINGPATSSLRLTMAELTQNDVQLRIKRLLDIIGSLGALVLLAPLFLAIAIAIKVTSRGPVLFRQVRVGQFGRKFTFLKFRSMYVNNDQSVHEEYVKRFIAGAADNADRSGNQQQLYKLVRDDRITPIGRVLRKTSLDELPQFLHVLRGEMSLVGPRPPLPYEVERYALWHRQRLLAVQPGLTGLWQVEGRSKVTFDEMVRLDIRYARSWSLWLDIKIILLTPRAILLGEGAC